MSNIDIDDDEPTLDASDKAERKTLQQVLAINMFQVAMSGVAGLIAHSTGLLGAALDNLADAAVYIVSLYAVGKGLKAKSRAANLSGILLFILGWALLAEVVRRFIFQTEPIGWLMIIIAIVNAASNIFALRLLKSHSEKGVHMQTSLIFTNNDMMVNLGIVISGIAVMILKSPYPDLIIGLITAGIVIWGGVTIIKNVRRAAQ